MGLHNFSQIHLIQLRVELMTGVGTRFQDGRPAGRVPPPNPTPLRHWAFTDMMVVKMGL